LNIKIKHGISPCAASLAYQHTFSLITLLLTIRSFPSSLVNQLLLHPDWHRSVYPAEEFSAAERQGGASEPANHGASLLEIYSTFPSRPVLVGFSASSPSSMCFYVFILSSLSIVGFMLRMREAPSTGGDEECVNLVCKVQECTIGMCVCVFLIITRIRSSHTARSYRKGYRANYQHLHVAAVTRGERTT
jgi:hypothetical protein